MERVPFLDDSGNDTASTLKSGRADVWRHRRTICLYCLCAMATTITVVWFLASSTSILAGYPSHPSATTGVFNSTLGFGALVLISLPERTDRRDAVSLIAARSGIQISKHIGAVHGEDINRKARPFGKANASVADGYIGSWRSHMDALQHVVDNRLETALLLEDDVDWDVRIKSQLATFSHGLKTSPFHDQSSTPISAQYPYGMDWDLMHLGAVIIKPAPQPFDKLWHPYVDPETPADPGCWVKDPKNPMFCWSKLMETLGVPNGSRAILPSHSITGLPAVAVTFEGAQRLIWELSLNKLDATLDWSIYGLLEQGRLKGWTVLPPLFGMWKMGGPADSDLLSFGQSMHAQIDGHSPGIEQSARQALSDRFAPGYSRWTSAYWEGFGISLDPSQDTRDPPAAVIAQNAFS